MNRRRAHPGKVAGRTVGNKSAVLNALCGGDGYLLTLAYDAARNLSELLIFPALEVDRGPVAGVFVTRRFID